MRQNGSNTISSAPTSREWVNKDPSDPGDQRGLVASVVELARSISANYSVMAGSILAISLAEAWEAVPLLPVDVAGNELPHEAKTLAQQSRWISKRQSMGALSMSVLNAVVLPKRSV